MRAGHPFDTARLDELRAEQRRVLRLIPTPLVVDAAPRVGPDVDDVPADDRPLTEGLLRAAAQELLDDRRLSELVDTWRQQVQLEIVDDFFARNGQRAEQLRIGPQAAFFDHAEIARSARQASEAPALPVELAPSFRRLLLLLVWADHLAGVIDPRLENLPAENVRAASSEQREVPPPPGADRPQPSAATTELPAAATLDTEPHPISGA